MVKGGSKVVAKGQQKPIKKNVKKNIKIEEVEGKRKRKEETLDNESIDTKKVKVSEETNGNEFDKNSATVDPAEFFDWFISPFPAKRFFEDHWEQQPLVIKREDRTYYDGWFSRKDLDDLLHTSIIRYGVNLDVARVVDGKRQFLTPTGRAYPGSVWDFFADGCSLRLLNPQSFLQPMWRMLSIMQEFFGCGMGVNIYLTPANAQGFAPHYDDIEAFVMQLEGSKHWRIYPPPTEEELPKYSSGNYTPEEMEEMGAPSMEVVLNAGDMLYFPRGWIHQAVATSEDSLHATVSTFQDNTWGTLFEKLMPKALSMAYSNSLEFRKGLPMDYMQYMGVSKGDRYEEDPRRDEFLAKFQELWNIMGELAPIDAAADEVIDWWKLSNQMAVKYLEDAYPPVLSQNEIAKSVSAGVTLSGNAVISPPIEGNHEINEDCLVKPIRRNVARIVLSDDGETIDVVHCMENARVYHQAEPQHLKFESEYGEIIEEVLEANDWIRVGDLPGDIETKCEVVAVLYDACLLVKKQ